MKMRTYDFILALCYLLQTSYCANNNYNNETQNLSPDFSEISMTTPLIIQKYGYPSELHKVTTKDGYILELHRIPYGKLSPPCRRKRKPPVLLMHGILASSADFILNGPDRSLAYLLADNNFDVWMGNIRGNRYSRNHRTLNPASTNFWDFTFHEVGVYDLPAIIDFILENTQQPNLFYIGHSMGSTMYSILISEVPNYSSKIRASIFLSPVIFLSNTRSPVLRIFSFLTQPLALLMDIFGVGEFLPRFELVSQIGRLFCKNQDFTQPLCTSIMFMFSGFNFDNLDVERFPIYLGHNPAGASTKTLMHYGQFINSGSFRQYDLGIVENLIRYNNIKPPLYQLNRPQAPLYLVYSNNDWFQVPEDVDKLFKELPPGVPRKVEVRDPNFAHYDFTIGKNSKEMVYEPLTSIMKNYV